MTRRRNTGGQQFAEGLAGGSGPEEDVEEGYTDAVTRHAKYLGIDPKEDADYMWIAKEALNADVPKGWVTGEGEGEYKGLVYYYNEASGQSTWDHPLDEHYRQLFKEQRTRDKKRKKRDSGATARQPSTSCTASLPARVDHGTCDKRKSSRRRRGSGSRSPRRKINSSRAGGKGSDQESIISRGGNDDHGDKGASKMGGQRDKRRIEPQNQRGMEHRGVRSASTSKERRRCRPGKDAREESGKGGKASSAELMFPSRSSAARVDAGTSSQSPIISSRRRKAFEREKKTSKGSRRSSRGSCSAHGFGGNGDDTQNREVEHSLRKSRDYHAEIGRGRRRGRRSTRGLERDKERMLSEPSSVSTSVERGVSVSPSPSPSPLATRSRKGRSHRHLQGANNIRTSDLGTSGNSQTRLVPSLKAKRERDKVCSAERSLSAGSPPKDQPLDRSTEGRSGDDHPGGCARGNIRRVETAGLGKADYGEDVNIIEDMDGWDLATLTAANIGRAGSSSKAALESTEEKPSKLASGPGGAESEIEHDTTWYTDDFQEVDFEAELLKMESAEDQESLSHEDATGMMITSERPSMSSAAEVGGKGKLGASPIPSKPAKLTEMTPGCSDVRERSGKADRQSRVACSKASGGEAEDGRNDNGVDSPLPDSKKAGTGGLDDVDKRFKLSPGQASRFANGEESARDWPGVSPRVNRSRGKSDDPSYTSQLPTPTRQVDQTGGSNNYSPAVAEVHAEVASRHGHRSRKEPKDRHVSLGADGIRGKGHGEVVEGRSPKDGESPNHEESSFDGNHKNRQGVGSRESKNRGKEELSGRESRRGDRDAYRRSAGSGDRGYEGWTDVDRKEREYNRRPYTRDAEVGSGRRDDRGRKEDGQRSRHHRREVLEDDGWETSGEKRKHEEQQGEVEMARTKRIWEKKISCLEENLASSKAREDTLRQEVTEGIRREAAARNQYLQAFEEGDKKNAALEKKLATAISEMTQMEDRFLEDGKKRIADVKVAESIEWEAKMAEAEASWKETEAGLQRELKCFQERSKAAAEDFLAQNHQAENGGSSVQHLRARLLTAETELEAQEHQGQALQDLQRRYAESSAKVAASVREAQVARDLTEKLRLDVAETSAREATLEAALAQAAREASVLNGEISRLREELGRSGVKNTDDAKETDRVRKELGLARDRVDKMESLLTRKNTYFESTVEGLRGRATELEAANASMEREMIHGQQEALSRLRQAERERDAALYEAKRSGERESVAEGWRLKEFHRAEAAEAAVATSGAELAELRSESARLRGTVATTVAPHLKRQAELQGQIEDARRDRAKLVAESERLKASHAAEMASMKDEISTRLPQIAEKAAVEAGRHWRRRAEVEISTAKRENNNRLRELQAALAETEARHHADVASAKAEAGRFKNVADKLAAENRNIRVELGRRLAGGISSSTTPPKLDTGRRTQDPIRLTGVRGAARRSTTGGNDAGIAAAADLAWEGALHAQVLGQVEAHIDSLRGLLRSSPDSNFLEAADCLGTSQGSNNKPGVDKEYHGCFGVALGACAPSSSGHLSQSNRRLLADYITKGQALTEAEDMRLNRLLRAMKANNCPPDSDKEGNANTMAEDSRERCVVEREKCGKSPAVGSRGDTVSSERATTSNVRSTAESTISFGVETPSPRGPSDVPPQASFADPEAGSESARQGPPYSGSHQGSVSTPSRARNKANTAPEGGGDLEDISDGGFHSGCWRRKYASGEMR